MKKTFVLLLFCLAFQLRAQENGRILQLENKLENIKMDSPGLSEKINVNIQNTTLPNFLIAVSKIHQVNLNVSPELSQVNIVNSFSDVSVADVLIFLCKEYELTIDFTGNILSVKRYTPPQTNPEKRIIPVAYNPHRESLSLDLKKDKLYDVFKKITKISGKNLVYSQGLENELLTVFIQEMPFLAALDKLAFSNSLILNRTRDNFYLFEKDPNRIISSEERGNNPLAQIPSRPRISNFYFQITDSISRNLDVDFVNIPVSSVIHDIGNALELDIFIASPLEGAGNATVKASNISFDELMRIIFEGTENTSNPLPNAVANNTNQNYGSNSQIAITGERFTFKKMDGIYFFGKVDQLSIRKVEIIPLMHRSIELMNDPIKTGRSAGRTVGYGQNYSNYNTNLNNNSSNSNYAPAQPNNQNNTAYRRIESDDFLEIVPEDIKKYLDIRVDQELNSFLVSGPSTNVDRFKSFIKDVDRPVPVILIEVMILEISRNATLEAGISWGLGTEPTGTEGKLYPGLNLNLGAETVNRILGRIDGSSFFNIGKVMPNFYANIKAQEVNGAFKIRSSPRIATLNGHRAYFSNGETSYYAVTNQTFIGSQNPTTSEITNYQPIDAELSLDVRPLVSGDGMVTLDMKVIQSDFNGERIAENAPPGINSREFTSIVKARNNDIIVLGGLEEKVKDDSGTGVPFFSKIPILKWLFSTRKRTDSKSKLTVLIKPTIIY